MRDYSDLEKRLRAGDPCGPMMRCKDRSDPKACICAEAAAAIAELTKRCEEAERARAKANNEWRRDYNEMVGNAELSMEDALRVLKPYAKRRLLTDLSGQYIADFLCRYAPAYAQEHGLLLQRQLPSNPLPDDPANLAEEKGK